MPSQLSLLSHLSPTTPLILHTDASDTATGAALNQVTKDLRKTVGFFSRKLSPAEVNYSTYDRKLLAIFTAVKHFQHLLECRIFVIKTDYNPLTNAFKQRLDKASSRQLRQLTYISEFTTEIMHVIIHAIEMPTTLNG